MAHTDGLGLGLGLGGLYAYADNPYCGYPYYDYNYAYCGPARMITASNCVSRRFDLENRRVSLDAAI